MTENNHAALADQAFANYQFGEGVEVTDTSGWEYSTPGNQRTRKVFVETQKEDDGPAPRWTLTFTVRFSPEDGSLTEAYAIDDKGQVWGYLPNLLSTNSSTDVSSSKDGGSVAPFALGQRFKFTPGQSVMCNGYPGTVKDMYGDGMVEVRVPGGLTCVSASYPDCYPRVSDSVSDQDQQNVKSDPAPIEYTTNARSDWDYNEKPSTVSFTVDMELAQEIVKLQAIVKANGLYKVEKFDYRPEFLDDDDKPVSMDAETLNVSADDFWFAGYIKHTEVEMCSERKRIEDMAKEFGIEIDVTPTPHLPSGT